MTAHTLTLAEATAIAEGALKKARAGEMNAMSVVVLDAAGTVKAMNTEDGASLLRPDIAYAKAWGCLGMGHSTRGQAGFSQQMPALYQAFVGISGNRLVPAPGGVFITRDGQRIGAIGVSGDLPDKDEACAVAGIEAAGLGAEI